MYTSSMSIAQLIKEYKIMKEYEDRAYKRYIESGYLDEFKLEVEEAKQHCIDIAIAIANTLVCE